MSFETRRAKGGQAAIAAAQTSTGTLKILRIEIDGHFHGSPDVPKPWVAEITGVDAQYGLARTFVEPMHDWGNAHRAWSGNLYGRIARFALRAGRLYEISRLRGKPSKRYVAREFSIIVDDEICKVAEIDALALAEQAAGPAVAYTVNEGTRIGRVEGLGTPAVCGFVLRDGRRLYRLRVGSLHEEVSAVDRRLILVTVDGTRAVSQAEALAHLVAGKSDQETP
jgi:hypothetical protein